ncbi:hypothetical protein SVIOM342S_06598 [Streptomyces violaceorubidus]
MTASPRYDGSRTPSRSSNVRDRGLANCPAIRPTFTTGSDAPWASTTAICSRVRSLPATDSCVAVANVSAQSPPWSSSASPRATAASRVRKVSHSAGKTSGGAAASFPVTSRSCSGSGHSGC